MIKNVLRMFVLNLAIVLPVTMIILALQGVSLGMVAFLVLSFLTPMVLRRQDKLQQFLTYPWRNSLYAYSWIWCLTFFFLGDSVIPYAIASGSMGMIMLGWIVVFTVCLLAMTIVAVILTLFADRPRFNRWFDDSLDMAVYSLPVPMLLLGDVLFLNVPIQYWQRNSVRKYLPFYNFGSMVLLFGPWVLLPFICIREWGKNKAFVWLVLW